jgi:biotin carboxyl carrier protein
MTQHQSQDKLERRDEGVQFDVYGMKFATQKSSFEETDPQSWQQVGIRLNAALRSLITNAAGLAVDIFKGARRLVHGTTSLPDALCTRVAAAHVRADAVEAVRQREPLKSLDRTIASSNLQTILDELRNKGIHVELVEVESGRFILTAVLPEHRDEAIAQGISLLKNVAPARDETELIAIKSPMIGTIYASPDSQPKPYVHVGCEIDIATVVCRIEALEIFNPIQAEIKGTIVKVLVGDGQAVEFGQPLFLVRQH